MGVRAGEEKEEAADSHARKEKESLSYIGTDEDTHTRRSARRRLRALLAACTAGLRGRPEGSLRASASTAVASWRRAAAWPLPVSPDEAERVGLLGGAGGEARAGAREE